MVEQLASSMTCTMPLQYACVPYVKVQVQHYKFMLASSGQIGVKSYI